MAQTKNEIYLEEEISSEDNDPSAATVNGNLETERRGGNSQSVPTQKATSKKKGGSNTARKLRSLKGNPDDSQLYYGQEEIEAVHQEDKYALSSQKPSTLLRKRRV